MKASILERVSSVGSNGIKKADLKRVIGKSCDDILQELLDKEEVIVDKKGSAYFVWTKQNYLIYLSQKDPKFKIVLDMIKNVNQTENTIKEHANGSGETQTTVSLQSYMDTNLVFEKEFDRCLAESSTLIGWAPFSLIRKKICESHSISRESFYSLASSLVETHREKYELSTGGEEGLLVRGLVHGFVRNI